MGLFLHDLCIFCAPMHFHKIQLSLEHAHILYWDAKVWTLIVVVSFTNQAQVILAMDLLPTTEDKFKKFSMVPMNTCAITNKQHIIIGGKLLTVKLFYSLPLCMYAFLLHQESILVHLWRALESFLRSKGRLDCCFLQFSFGHVLAEKTSGTHMKTSFLLPFFSPSSSRH